MTSGAIDLEVGVRRRVVAERVPRLAAAVLVGVEARVGRVELGRAGIYTSTTTGKTSGRRRVCS
jgi:hypothetical protein